MSMMGTKKGAGRQKTNLTTDALLNGSDGEDSGNENASFTQEHIDSVSEKITTNNNSNNINISSSTSTSSATTLLPCCAGHSKQPEQSSSMLWDSLSAVKAFFDKGAATTTEGTRAVGSDLTSKAITGLYALKRKFVSETAADASNEPAAKSANTNPSTPTPKPN